MFLYSTDKRRINMKCLSGDANSKSRKTVAAAVGAAGATEPDDDEDGAWWPNGCCSSRAYRRSLRSS